jgi:hypothetical protein
MLASKYDDLKIDSIPDKSYTGIPMVKGFVSAKAIDSSLGCLSLTCLSLQYRTRFNSDVKQKQQRTLICGRTNSFPIYQQWQI